MFIEFNKYYRARQLKTHYDRLNACIYDIVNGLS
jgi:hypothetical protein